MLKFLTVILILLFVWWRVSRWMDVRRRRARGEDVSYQVDVKGFRPITVLSVIFLLLYGGYVIWFALNEWFELL
ncbi:MULTISPECIES: hypothetical protein [Thioalkalivibrio]|uniref:Uncharacterized protein n=1 Tax=Thioalkalivibrio versutus TaxID=106634 RepID=A0A0G3FZM3_9GAMM|nr:MULTISPECIES: hypothetical protein [Thioalkalivibrio]AKJ94398.1 hypothetical protein TVD_02980 [Thioalkalivibrio versutus]